MDIKLVPSWSEKVFEFVREFKTGEPTFALACNKQGRQVSFAGGVDERHGALHTPTQCEGGGRCRCCEEAARQEEIQPESWIWSLTQQLLVELQHR